MSSLRGRVIYAESHIRQWSSRITQVAAACGCQLELQTLKNHAVAVPPGVRFEITARRPYCIKVTVRHVLAAGMKQQKNLTTFYLFGYISSSPTHKQLPQLGLFIIHQHGSDGRFIV